MAIAHGIAQSSEGPVWRVTTLVRHATPLPGVCTLPPAASLLAEAVHLLVTLEMTMTTNTLVRGRRTDLRATHPTPREENPFDAMAARIQCHPPASNWPEKCTGRSLACDDGRL